MLFIYYQTMNFEDLLRVVVMKNPSSNILGFKYLLKRKLCVMLGGSLTTFSQG